MKIQKICKSNKKKILMALMAGMFFLSGCSTEKLPEIMKGSSNSDEINSNVDNSESEFYFLNISNDKNCNFKEIKNKIKLCNENGKYVGLFVEVKSEKKIDFFKMVQSIKELASKHDINLPIFLKIDNIIRNDNLALSEKQDLINNFLAECKDNGIFYGVFGEDNNLSYMDEFFYILPSCEIGLIEDDSIDYKKDYNMFIDVNGNIEFPRKLMQSISEEGYNKSDKFGEEYIHVVEKDEDIDLVAMKYDVSVNDILKYNNIKKNDVVEGKKLKIPNYRNDFLFNNLKEQMVDSEEQKVDSEDKETSLENSEANNINNHKNNNDTNVYIDENGNVTSIKNDNSKNNSFIDYTIALGVCVIMGATFIKLVIYPDRIRRLKEEEVGGLLTTADDCIEKAGKLMTELRENYPAYYNNNRRRY